MKSGGKIQTKYQQKKMFDQRNTKTNQIIFQKLNRKILLKWQQQNQVVKNQLVDQNDHYHRQMSLKFMSKQMIMLKKSKPIVESSLLSPLMTQLNNSLPVLPTSNVSIESTEVNYLSEPLAAKSNTIQMDTDITKLTKDTGDHDDVHTDTRDVNTSDLDSTRKTTTSTSASVPVTSIAPTSLTHILVHHQNQLLLVLLQSKKLKDLLNIQQNLIYNDNKIIKI
jgi:hypothetical protein